MRDHLGIIIEEFNGYYNRGDAETVPIDHFIESLNVRFVESGFETRSGIDLYQSPVGIALDNVLRIHPYTMQNQQSLLVLTTGGNIHHVVSSTVVHLNILQKAAMTDFNVVSFAGRAYITPFFTNASSQEVGLQNEFLYVYLGLGAVARKAGASPPTGSALVAVNATAGFSDLGFKVFAVVYETDTGYLTAPGPAIFATATSNNELLGFDISNIPVSPDTFVTKRHIIATKSIIDYNGDQDGYQFFFVPGGNIDNNIATTKHVNFFDIDLLEDASHLLDNFANIPAGVGLTLYHNRLVLTTTFTDISVAYVSHPGEPEAIDQVDGLLIVPLDGLPLTNCQEFRDILYLFKRTRTVGYSDNQDVPGTWQSFIVDEGIGAPVHGVGTVLDSGGVNVDYLLIADYSGIMLFNGAYTRPELSWKIRNFWFDLDRTQFREIELVNDSINEVMYCVLPSNIILVGNYQNGLNAKRIRWSKWTFDFPITSMELIDTSTVLLGGTVNVSNQSGLYKFIEGKVNDTLYDTSNNLFDVKIPNPTVRFGYTNLSKIENIVHFTGFRLRVTGAGILVPTVYSLNDILFEILTSISLITTTDRELMRLMNFQTQRMSLELKTTDINNVFQVNKLILFAKEVFAEFPSIQ